MALWGAVAFDRISVDSLRTNITWLAADQRQGRMTPSPGLDASADYLAGQFREAGLTGAGPNGSFFQTAQFSQVTPSGNFRMTLQAGSQRVDVSVGSASVHALTALEYNNAPVVRLARGGAAPDVAGRIVIGGEAWAEDAALYSLESRKPALILLVENEPRPNEKVPVLMDADPALPPLIRIYGGSAGRILSGQSDVRLTLQVGAPARHDVTLRNVAGILRGSDSSVRDQFIIVSAHYDHLGTRPPGPGNRIYHGANDDASGAASLVEIAKALGADPHPRRGVLFLALFGEEEGLLGSAWYVRHPLIPIARTVADINLEQLGRTDSSDGPEVARFAFTGPSYSNLPQTMGAAAKPEGVSVYRKDTADDYFDRSDNFSFALAGIVAHTAVVAFEFPDYHDVGDEADKIDYRNLAKVDRGIAAGVAAVADGQNAPVWSDARGARVYRDAAVK
jgi:hypothetical protein